MNIGIVAQQAMLLAAPTEELWRPDMLGVPLRIYLSDESSVTNVSGAASNWQDVSGNGFDFGQTSATQRPAINASAIAGRRALIFDGVNDFLNSGGNLAARDIMRNTGAGWVFVVSRTRGANAENSAQRVFTLSNNATTTGDTPRLTMFRPHADNLASLRFNSRRLDADSINIFIHDPPPSSVGDWEMLLGERDWGGGATRTHVDGGTPSEQTGLSAGLTSNTRSGQELRIGRAGGEANMFWAGDCACMIIGSGALPSAADIDRLFGWAAHRYGLTARLPGGHPYKSVAPTAPPPVATVDVVATSATVYDVAATVDITIPAETEPGDLLLAAVMRRSAMSAPAGWTLHDSQEAVSGTPITQWTDVYLRVAEIGDAGSTATFTQASPSARIGGAIVAVRCLAGTPVVVASAKEAENAVGFNQSRMAEVQAPESGLAVTVFSFVLSAETGTVQVFPPWSLRSVASAANNRLAVATRQITAPGVAAGTIDRNAITTIDGIGKITLILAPPP